MSLDLDAADELYAAVGFRITRIRRARGLNQEAVAKAAGLARTSITNAESGRQRLPLHVLLAIAQALGVELADLLALDREPPILAQQLPQGAQTALAEALEEVERMRAVLDKLTGALSPLAYGAPT